MARKVRTEEEDAQIDMTPMLDIVFIMLIFFIVTLFSLKKQGSKSTSQMQPGDSSQKCKHFHRRN